MQHETLEHAIAKALSAYSINKINPSFEDKSFHRLYEITMVDDSTSTLPVLDTSYIFL